MSWGAQLRARRVFSVDNGAMWRDSSTARGCAAFERDFPGGAENLAKTTGSRAFERFTGVQV